MWGMLEYSYETKGIMVVVFSPLFLGGGCQNIGMKPSKKPRVSWYIQDSNATWIRRKEFLEGKN
jgi:hypothetical protein